MLLEYNTKIMYELAKLDQGAVPNLHFLAMENWGILTEKLSYDKYVFLDITYWNYNAMFQVKVSLIVLQRDSDLMLTQTKRPNLINCVSYMIYWH